MSPWFRIRRPQPTAALSLFCFPYAGGAAAVFDSWSSRLTSHVEVVAVQPPGRAERMRDPPIAAMDAMVAELLSAIGPYLERPFVFFGHSYGALVGFELARRMQLLGLDGLQHLIISGKRAPQLPPIAAPLHAQPRRELIESLRTYGGVPEEILQDDDLIDLCLPTLRADLALGELHRFVPDPRLRSDATLFGGLADPLVPQADLLAWASLLDGRISHHVFPGDHFFMSREASQVLPIVDSVLEEVIRRRTRIGAG